MKRFLTLLIAVLMLLSAACKHSEIQQATAVETSPLESIQPKHSHLASVMAATEPMKPIAVKVDSYKELVQLFSQHRYDFQTLNQGAPALILDTFPEDIASISSIKEKKRLFFLSLLPMVLINNQQIAKERQQVIAYSYRVDHGEILRLDEQKTLREISKRYRLKGDPVNDYATRAELIKRVDIIPEELVLAQAANESAWGTSRFAQLANNIFGEWTFTPGTGIVPVNRPEGAIYEVRKFDSLQASLQSYMRNLNTNRAYRPLRDLRARLRVRGFEVDGTTLAAGLTRYSSRGMAYVRDLRQLMRQNKLARMGEVDLRTKARHITLTSPTVGALSPSTRNHSVF